MAGSVPSASVNPVPVTAIAFTVTGAVPVEFSVSDCVADVFTVTRPNLRLTALNASCGLRAAVPLPLRATVSALLPDELLSIIICPVAAPAAGGLNFTCNTSDCPGLRVDGKVPPTSEKPAPVIEAAFTVTGAVPVEFNVNDCVVDVFTVTPPKFRLLLLTVSCGLKTAVPLPLSATVIVVLPEEVLLTITCPVAAPLADGLNLTRNVID